MLALVTVFTGAACYSSNYPRGTAANVALLADLSDKLADYCRAGFVLNGRQITSEEMGEFYYALRKARAYATTTRRESSRRSYRDFERLLDADESYIHAADEYRLSPRDRGQLAAVLARHGEVKRIATMVTEDLRAESR